MTIEQKKEALKIIKKHGFYSTGRIPTSSWDSLWRKDECKFRIDIQGYVGIYIKEERHTIDVVYFNPPELHDLDKWLEITLKE